MIACVESGRSQRDGLLLRYLDRGRVFTPLRQPAGRDAARIGSGR